MIFVALKKILFYFAAQIKDKQWSSHKKIVAGFLLSIGTVLLIVLYIALAPLLLWLWTSSETEIRVTIRTRENCWSPFGNWDRAGIDVHLDSHQQFPPLFSFLPPINVNINPAHVIAKTKDSSNYDRIFIFAIKIRYRSNAAGHWWPPLRLVIHADTSCLFPLEWPRQLINTRDCGTISETIGFDFDKKEESGIEEAYSVEDARPKMVLDHNQIQVRKALFNKAKMQINMELQVWVDKNVCKTK